MDTVVEIVSAVPSTGVILGTSLSLACWLGLVVWRRRLPAVGHASETLAPPLDDPVNELPPVASSLQVAKDTETASAGNPARVRAGRERDRWELLLDSSDDGFWEWPQVDEDYQWWSDGFYRSLGFERTAFPSSLSRWLDLTHPADRQSFRDSLEKTATGCQRLKMELRMKLQNGSYRWFRVDAVGEHSNHVDNLDNEAGRRVMGSIRDVQRHREARIRHEDSDELFRSVFEHTTVGLALIDRAGCVLHANPTLTDMLGVEDNQIRGVEWRSMIKAEDWAKCEPAFRQIFEMNQRFVRMENRYLTARRESIHALTGLSRLSRAFDNGALVIAHVQDVSALKEAERAANEANLCKSQFLAHMSHEIRTPLNGIMGMTQLVLGTDLGADQREFLETALSSSEQLLSVINDILDLSKIEAGRLEVAEDDFQLRDSLKSMITPLSLRAQERGVEFVLDVDPAIPDGLFGDWHRIQQVLINLVGNAIKFTEKGEIAVSLNLQNAEAGVREVGSADEQDPTWVDLHVRVTDTGLGIPRDQQERIFGAFSQVESSLSRGHQGTGLGLAISAELVRLMGGRLTVSSELGKGSRFDFQLRLRVVGHRMCRHGWESRDDFRGFCVLVVDPSQAVRESLARLLTHWGATAVVSMDLRLSSTEMPAGLRMVMVSDRVLEEAMARCEPLWERCRTKGIACVPMVSSAERAEEMIREGAQDVFLKPVDPKRLLEFMKRLSGLAGGLGEAEEVISSNDREVETRRFLVAEDGLVSRKVVESLLTHQGHEVVTVGNGLEAVTAIRRGSFDAVFMDVNMPEMDGLQATQLIREREEESDGHTWIIALTAQAFRTDRDRCLAAGMDDYLAKPIRVSDLTEVVRRVPDMDAEPGSSGSNEAAEAQIVVREASDGECFAVDIAWARTELEIGRDRIGDALANESPAALESSAQRLETVLRRCQFDEAASCAARLAGLGRKRKLAAGTEIYAALVRCLVKADGALQRRVARRPEPFRAS